MLIKISKYFDYKILYSASNILTKYLGSLLSIIFLAIVLDEKERGFYFTFLSLVALKIFFELGLGNIITQYVAKEIGKSKNGKININPIISFVKKWFGIISVLLFFFLLFFGDFFFIDQNELVDWRTPWILTCLGASFFLFISPFLSIVSGLGSLEEVLKIRTISGLFRLITFWLGLLFGFKLYSLGISLIVEVLCLVYFYNRRLYITIIPHLSFNDNKKFNYYKDIFPYQWKIAISWISGYFIFQLFTPLVFRYVGPEASGKMGMTLMFINAIGAFPILWINTKIPEYSRLYGESKILKLFNEFYSNLKSSIVVILLLIFVFCSVYYIVSVSEFFINIIDLNKYLLPLKPITFLLIALFFNHIISSYAIVLRANMKEPYLYTSVLMGFLVLSSSLLTINDYGVNGICFAYLVSSLIVFVPSRIIYIKHKNNYQNEDT